MRSSAAPAPLRRRKPDADRRPGRRHDARIDPRELVDRAIYNELALGAVRPELRQQLLAVCRDAIDHRGADGVILGCTELPLVLAEGDLPVPVVDTARVHVEAILDRALSEADPTSHGMS
jgi:aspartate/glutamate racemase